MTATLTGKRCLGRACGSAQRGVAQPGAGKRWSGGGLAGDFADGHHRSSRRGSRRGDLGARPGQGHPLVAGLDGQTPGFCVRFTPNGSSWANWVGTLVRPAHDKLTTPASTPSYGPGNRHREWIPTWNDNPGHSTGPRPPVRSSIPRRLPLQARTASQQAGGNKSKNF